MTRSTSAPAETLDERYERLNGILRGLDGVVVGFSGGVDSTFLLKAAVDQLGSRVVAVTAVSASLPERERVEAIRLAAAVGAKHLLVDSDEFEDASYITNAPNRCFFCKKELFEILEGIARQERIGAIAYGAITDDEGDFRPGMEAARRSGARAPLLEAGLSKQDVRELSRRVGLATWDKPASACLSSRIPHGTPIDRDLLHRVERSEDFLLSIGLGQVRVRAHGDMARIECAPGEIEKLADPSVRSRVTSRFKELGFRFVTLDLEGYRSGSLNPDNS